VLAASGLDLIVGAAASGAEEAAFYRQLVENRRVDGIILARTRRQDPRLAYLLDRGFPVVVHGRAEERRAHAHVDVDGVSAFRRAAERLIGFGHRRIALLNAPAQYSFAHHREAGWRAALREAGLAPGPMLEAEATEENGFRLASEVLAKREAPTALLCATDRLAVGALHALSHAGRRAGRDVAVIGYDNLPVATYTDPPLTTFDTGVEPVARRMVEMMLALLGGAAPGALVELREATLIARRSDGPKQENHKAAPEGERRKGRKTDDTQDGRAT
jgi:LacI family transcriptional regulator